MYPSDYTVAADQIEKWKAKFASLSSELGDFARSVANAEAETSGTCPGPFASLILRASIALDEAALSFDELERDRVHGHDGPAAHLVPATVRELRSGVRP